MDEDYDDLDEDIERLKIVLQDDDAEESDRDGELRVLEDDDRAETVISRPSTTSDVTASSFPTTSLCTDGDEALIRFDPSTITAETCLAMNRAYQEVLLDTLRQVEISLAENRNKQRLRQNEINEFHTGKQSRNKETKLFKYSVPYFKDSDGNGPPPNEDMRSKELLKENKLHVKPKPAWLPRDRKKLLEAVQMDALEQQIRPLLAKLELESEKSNACKSKEEIEASKERIHVIKREIEEKRRLSADVLLQNVDSSKTDFMKIAVLHMKGKFDAGDCEAMWNNVLNPKINRKKWTKEEETQLETLAEKHGLKNWKVIAEELGSGRTPFQCLQHYQINNFGYDQSEWTETEDDLLREVVETCRYGTGDILWTQVAYYIDRRSQIQCKARWNKIDTQMKRGKWNKVEDMLLLTAVETLGASFNWDVIQEFVPGRNAVQCKDRYMNCLNTMVDCSEFTYQEDRQLLNLFSTTGGSWSGIASKMKNRNASMLLSRHRKLQKWEELCKLFFQQPKSMQEEQLCPAFTILPDGLFDIKEIPTKRMKRIGRPLGSKGKKLSEVERLKLNAKMLLGDDSNDFSIKEEPVSDEETPETTQEDRAMTEKEAKKLEEEARNIKKYLTSFQESSGILAEDYIRQQREKNKGIKPVPRPPPVRDGSLRSLTSNIQKLNSIQEMLVTQVEPLVNSIEHESDARKNEAKNMMHGLMSLAEQKSKARDYVCEAIGKKRPCDLSVGELLEISRDMTKHLKLPQRKGRKRKKEEEEEGISEGEDGDTDSDEEEADGDGSWCGSDSDVEITSRSRKRKILTEDSNSDSDDDSDREFFAKLEEEAAQLEGLKGPSKKIKRTEESMENFKQVMKAHRDVRQDLRQIITTKYKQHRHRRKKKYMFPYSYYDTKQYQQEIAEKDKLSNKSLVLLMKTLDVNPKAVYEKASQCRRRSAAMALLKSAGRTRGRTRSSTKQIESTSNTSIENEMSEVVLGLRAELKIPDDIVSCEEPEVKYSEALAANHSEKSASKQKMDSCPLDIKIDQSLPYIPPNDTNLRGLTKLVLDHRCLIDQSSVYFNMKELRAKLYAIKAKGPNPLLNVLMAMGKTEADHSKHKESKNLPEEFRKLKKEAAWKLADERMANVRKSYTYKKLMARFQSVFTWPALLSTIPIPKDEKLPNAILKEELKDSQARVAAAQAKAKEKADRNKARPTRVPSVALPETYQMEAAPVKKDTSNNEELVEYEFNVVKAEVDDEPEEVAIERLVHEIMNQYDQDRLLSKVRYPRAFGKGRPATTQAQYQGRYNRRRTMILKRLGLYEKMKEYEDKRQREIETGINQSLAAVRDDSNPTTTQNYLESNQQHFDESVQFKLGESVKSKLSVLLADRKTSELDRQKPETGDLTNKPLVKELEANDQEYDADDMAQLDRTIESNEEPKNQTEKLGKPQSTRQQLKSSEKEMDQASKLLVTKSAKKLEKASGTPEVPNDASGELGDDGKHTEVKESRVESHNDSMDTTDQPGTSKGIKRKRGRQHGVKLTCYSSNQAPTRRSSRVNTENIEVYARPKKEQKTLHTISNARLKQYIPESIVPKIEIPILNKPTIPLAKPKNRKPYVKVEEPRKRQYRKLDISKLKCVKSIKGVKKALKIIEKQVAKKNMMEKPRASRKATATTTIKTEPPEAPTSVGMLVNMNDINIPLAPNQSMLKKTCDKVKDKGILKALGAKSAKNLQSKRKKSDKDTSYTNDEILEGASDTVPTVNEMNTNAAESVTNTRDKERAVETSNSTRSMKTSKTGVKQSMQKPERESQPLEKARRLQKSGKTSGVDAHDNTQASKETESGSKIESKAGNVVRPLLPANSSNPTNVSQLISSIMSGLSTARGQTSINPAPGPMFLPVSVNMGGQEQVALVPIFPNTDGKYTLPEAPSSGMVNPSAEPFIEQFVAQASPKAPNTTSSDNASKPPSSETDASNNTTNVKSRDNSNTQGTNTETMSPKDNT